MAGADSTSNLLQEKIYEMSRCLIMWWEYPRVTTKRDTLLIKSFPEAIDIHGEEQDMEVQWHTHSTKKMHPLLSKARKKARQNSNNLLQLGVQEEWLAPLFVRIESLSPIEYGEEQKKDKKKKNKVLVVDVMQKTITCLLNMLSISYIWWKTLDKG